MVHIKLSQPPISTVFRNNNERYSIYNFTIYFRLCLLTVVVIRYISTIYLRGNYEKISLIEITRWLTWAGGNVKLAVVRCEFGTSLGFARLSPMKVNLSSWKLWYEFFTLWWCRTKYIECGGILFGGSSSNWWTLFISFLSCISSRWIIPQYLILLLLMLITILEITQTPHHHS